MAPVAKLVNDQFTDEFTYFAVHRSEVRRFMPTPDLFPLFCELVESAKKYYVSLPRVQRNTLRHIPFQYFGRVWSLRVQYVRMGRPGELHLNICSVSPRATLVTVPVLVVDLWNWPCDELHSDVVSKHENTTGKTEQADEPTSVNSFASAVIKAVPVAAKSTACKGGA